MAKNIVQIIFSILDIVLFIGLILLSVFSYISKGIFFLLFFFPLLATLIVFLVAKHKKLKTDVVWKRSVVAYFLFFVIPLGLTAVFTLIKAPLAVSKYGVAPELENAMSICQSQCKSALNQSQEFFQQCYQACMDKLIR